jgi:hypothetical protein
MGQHTRALDHDSSEFEPGWEVDAADRAGPPIVDRRRRRVVRLIFVMVLLAGTGWLWREGRLDGLAPVLQHVAQTLGSLAVQRSPPAGSERAAVPPPIEARDIAARPPAPPSPPAPERSPDPAAATPPAATEEAVAAADAAAANPPAPLPAVPPATDALGRRAEAVGLHPELSRALLARLSEEDYRNAAVAIKTALAETPDEATLEWPARASARQARFRILFVVGAPDRCRRYVVEIAKDGWLTTAPPLERCGIARPAGRAHSRPLPRQG